MNSPLSEKKTAVYNSFPSKSEGKDGDMRFVNFSGNVYLLKKINNEWFKVKMEKL